MEIGIIGLEQSGKSTLFEIMTGVRSREIYSEPSVRGMAQVPDERFDRLVKIFHPRKVSPVSVPFVDPHVTGDAAWEETRRHLMAADGLLHIVNAFTAQDAAEVGRRYRRLYEELILSDLVVVEKRLERLAKLPANSLKAEEALHAALLPRFKEHLEAGIPLRTLTLSAEEVKGVRGFSFWTLRPELVVLNLRSDQQALAEEMIAAIESTSTVIAIDAMIEAEIAELPPEERQEFLQSIGVTSPAFERILQASFDLLGRIRYFTVGEDEVKGWVIPKGATAPKAAAAIHKDFERGFIKAEVVSFEDFIACGESIAAAKAAGKLRLEGKEYIVKDADIISFRFNV